MWGSAGTFVLFRARKPAISNAGPGRRLEDEFIRASSPSLGLEATNPPDPAWEALEQLPPGGDGG
jgi:hypothetical protein